jgi:hypothetical protein
VPALRLVSPALDAMTIFAHALSGVDASTTSGGGVESGGAGVGSPASAVDGLEDGGFTTRVTRNFGASLGFFFPPPAVPPPAVPPPSSASGSTTSEMNVALPSALFHSVLYPTGYTCVASWYPRLASTTPRSTTTTPSAAANGHRVSFLVAALAAASARDITSGIVSGVSGGVGANAGTRSRSPPFPPRAGCDLDACFGAAIGRRPRCRTASARDRNRTPSGLK